jgi:hypothetical protein
MPSTTCLKQSLSIDTTLDSFCFRWTVPLSTKYTNNLEGPLSRLCDDLATFKGWVRAAFNLPPNQWTVPLKVRAVL